MKTNQCRQTRREALCIRARSPHGHEAGTSPEGVELTAGDPGLAQVAERIAQELHLSPDVIDYLLSGGGAAGR